MVKVACHDATFGRRDNASTTSFRQATRIISIIDALCNSLCSTLQHKPSVVQLYAFGVLCTLHISLWEYSQQPTFPPTLKALLLGYSSFPRVCCISFHPGKT